MEDTHPPPIKTGIRMTLNKYLVTLALLLATQLVEADDKLPAVDYLRQVKPILTRHCVGSHGIDKHESGYRLDIA